MERTQHVEHLIAEYSLELLSKKQSKTVRDHLEGCAKCKAVLQNDRKMIVDIRDSITAVAARDSRRLQELMPPLPAAKNQLLDNFGWQRQLAIVGFLLVLVFGSLLVQRELSSRIWVSRTPAMQSTTILVTDTPTQTSVATRPESASSPDLKPTPVAKDMILLPKPAMAPVPTSPFLH